MTRKLKALGLAVVAALAVGAVGAMSATAETGGHFIHDDPGHWVNIMGTQEGTVAQNELIDHDLSDGVTCPNNRVSYSASIAETTTTAITVKAVYPTNDTAGECSTTAGYNAGIHMNECGFLLTTASAPGNEHTAAHLHCKNTGEEVTVTVDPPIVGTCITHIPPQTPTAGGVKYTAGTVGGKADLTLDITTAGITNNKTEVGFLGCAGEGGESDNSTFVGTATAEGFNTAGGRINLRSIDSKQVHEEKTHKEETHNTETEETLDFRFGAEHTLFTGSQVVANGYTFGVLLGSVECESTSFVGTAASSEAKTIAIKPSYSDCEGLGRVVTTHMNGCSYVLGLTGSGTDGKVEIKCPGEEKIETTVDMFPGGCTLTIPPQTTGGTVDYKEEGSGSTQDLLLTWTLAGIDYVRDGCEFEGTSTNATYSGSITLKGENTSEEQVGVWIE